MRLRHFILSALIAGPALAVAQTSLQNERYALEVSPDGSVALKVSRMPVQTLRPEFTVLWSEADPLCQRNASHPNYPVAPRTAVRWRNREESLESLNAWVSAPEFVAATGMKGVVSGEGKARAWQFLDAAGKVKVKVSGERAYDTTRIFGVGHRAELKPARWAVEGNRVRWEYAPAGQFGFAAELALPAGAGDPALSFSLTPQKEAFYSVAFMGAPEAALRETIAVPQECDARGHKQFDFVVSEADLHLPRVQIATEAGNVAVVAEPAECRFRLPTIADSRFGLMLASEAGRLKPVVLAPLLGGPESKMRAGEAWRFGFRCVVQAGDWKKTYAHIARDVFQLRDLRDNSGPGSLNATLEHVMDFLADRRGGNHALWDAQQKYYDYFTDKTGVFKPFSPLYGLGAAIVTDDEEFFRTRARAAVEYALSRPTSVFAPYDNADNKQANSAGRVVGSPYLSYAQLLSLDELLQRRNPALKVLAAEKGPTKGKIADALARWRATEDVSALQEAGKLGASRAGRNVVYSEEDLFDLLELVDETRSPLEEKNAAREAAYHLAAKLNLYPMPPEQNVTVDAGGHAPVHPHSYGRHKNQWGFPRPQPVAVPEQTVPAWRIARVGLPGIAYPIEYWMNTHGALMRTAGLTHDDLLRDTARWGMVGRFGNFPGDNRSIDSLIPESPDAVDHMPWEWNFATVNAGHAWDFAGAVIDFLVSDAFERSGGKIDFPAVSTAGSNFRVRVYGGAAGRFYGDHGVHLWLPRGLVQSDNRQIDWLAGQGNGLCYLALWNQSAQEQEVKITLDPFLVQCGSRETEVWRDNMKAPAMRVQDNQIATRISPKGIVAFVIPAEVKPRLQAKLYAKTPALDEPSRADVVAPFGKVHAMLLSAGRELTSAYVYTEALPEDVIAARLQWRQGEGPWQQLTDAIYPYEFSPELRDGAGVFSAVVEVENARREVQRSPLITLGGKAGPDLPPSSFFAAPASARTIAPAELSDDFLSYLQRAANGNDFGLRKDGRYYPYSTPQGRRIGARLPLWDDDLYAKGCSREEALERLRSDLTYLQSDLKRMLAAREPKVGFDKLDQRQRETLLDFSVSETIGGMRSEFFEAVLARDWTLLVQKHLYIRYAGHAPDHPRNKAFADRWGIE